MQILLEADCGAMSSLSTPLHMRLTEWPKHRQFAGPVAGERIRLKSQLVDFSSLVPIYGRRCVSALLDGFAQASFEGRLPQPSAQAAIFRRFLQFIANEAVAEAADGGAEEIYKRLLEGAKPDARALEQCLAAFTESARNLDDVVVLGPARPRTRLAAIALVRRTLRDVCPALAWPPVAYQKVYGLGLRTAYGRVASLGVCFGLQK